MSPRSPRRRRRAAGILPLLLLAPLAMAPLASPAPLAYAAGTDAPVYSPAPAPLARYSVSGKVYQDREGIVTITNAGDTLLNGVKVYAYWVDEDGTVSPTSYDLTRSIDGADGQFAINLAPFTDAEGTQHVFDAGPAEELRVWIDNPDPSRYEISYGESQYMLGTSVKRDANSWNLVANYAANWIITLREKPQDWTRSPAPVDGTSGGTVIDPGNVTGVVFWNYAHTWGATVGANYDPALGDVPAAGIPVYASFLTDAAITKIDAWKAAHPGWTEVQLQDWIAAQVKAAPSWIAETVTTTTGADGRFDVTFKAAPLDVNANYMNVSIDAPDGAIVYGPWAYNNWASPGSQTSAFQVNAGVIGGASNVKYALLPGDPLFDVVEYDTSAHPAKAGDTVTTSTRGLSPNVSGFAIQWTDETGAVVATCSGLTTDALGALPSCPLTVPSTLSQVKTYNATLVAPGGASMLADSFIALPVTAAAPAGSVGDPYAGSVKAVLPAGATAAYSAAGAPAGIVVNPDGTITGTPTTPGTTTFPVTVTVTYAKGTTGTLQVPVTIMVTDTPLAGGTVGAPLAQDVRPVGYPEGATVSNLAVANLPAGLSYDAAAGQITGTPLAEGTSDVTVSYDVTLADGTVVHVVDTVPVAISPAPDTTAPVVTPIADATVPEDQPIAPIPVASDDPTATLAVTGLPDGLSVNPNTGAIEGTPTTPGVSTVTVTATDAAGNSSTRVFTITVTDRTAPAIAPIVDQTTPEDLPMTAVGIRTDDPSATIAVDGLPAGVAFDAAAGEIAGIPTTPGTYPITVTATDAAGNSSTATFTITVTADTIPPDYTPNSDITTPEDVAMTPVTLSPITPGDTIAVSGLPAGVIFDPATGQISGTPTEPGAYTVTVVVTDRSGNTTTDRLTFTVTDTTPPLVEPIADVTVPEDQPIAPIVVAKDDPNATVAVTGLPDGVAYDPATGRIEGTPTTPGTYPVTVTVTDAAGNATAEEFVITVTDRTGPAITPIADVTYPEDAPIVAIPVRVDDESATVAVTGLPDGVAYDPATGRIEGTPTTPGTYPVIVTVTDAAGNATTEEFVITVTDATAPVVAPIADATVPEDQAIAPIAVTTADPAATVTVDGLPDGVAYDPATGRIEGTPTTPGVYPVTVTVTDPAGNAAEEKFVITVTDATAPAITPIADTTAPEDRALAAIPVAVDDPTATVTVDGLPAGVIYDPGTGRIEGTPATPGSYPVTVTATDPAGNTATEQFILVVTPDTTPSGITPIDDVTVPEDVALTPIPVQVDDPTATVVVGGLPDGVAYDPAAGTIAGTPTTPGAYPVVVTVTDGNGNVSEERFTLLVEDRTSPVVQPIDDVTVPEDAPIAPISVEVDDATATVAVDGLPAGVIYDPTTGLIEGTPTTPGTYPVTVTVTDAAGNATTVELVITVTDRTPPAVQPIGDVAVPEDQAMTPIAVVAEPGATVEVSGLPEGTSYDPATGLIDGTPTTPGIYQVVVIVTDAAGNTAKEVLTITVTPSGGGDLPSVPTLPDVTVPEDAPIDPVDVGVGIPGATTTVEGLPDGVVHDPATDLITGTPTTPGEYLVTVTTTAQDLTIVRAFTMTVAAASGDGGQGGGPLATSGGAFEPGALLASLAALLGGAWLAVRGRRRGSDADA